MSAFFDIIPVQYYKSIYFIGIYFLCLLIVFRYSFSKSNLNITQTVPYSQLVAIVFTIALLLYVGFRPINGYYFVDMKMYAHTYNNIWKGDLSTVYSDNGEWLFPWIGNLCKRIGLIDREFFLFISSFYFGLMAITCWRLMRNNMFVAVLFCFISFSCFAYATNGIRNGLAASMMLLAISFFDSDNKWKYVLILLLIYISVSIHKAMTLPAICAIVAFINSRSTSYAIVFWIISIFISLVAGNYVTQFFVDLGFDDRMESYANLDDFGEVMESRSQKSGFRVDFIIYSIMPIIMVWYVTIRRNFRDTLYNIIASTYILSNSFWIMVIRSEQSNRFAYLSWFLYPIVIAYPLLRMNIWDNQDRKLAAILFLYSSFTFFMEFVYYG